MILDAPALYLECRYTRAQSLRILRDRLNRQINRTYDDGDKEAREKLRVRKDRVQRHLDALSGDAL